MNEHEKNAAPEGMTATIRGGDGGFVEIADNARKWAVSIQRDPETGQTQLLAFNYEIDAGEPQLIYNLETSEIV